MFVSKVLSVAQTAGKERRKKVFPDWLFVTGTKSYRKAVESRGRGWVHHLVPCQGHRWSSGKDADLDSSSEKWWAMCLYSGLSFNFFVFREANQASSECCTWLWKEQRCNKVAQ